MSRAKKSIQTRLNCPFCDEISIPASDKNMLITPQKVYVPRTCIMGHDFWSVEYIPENQAELVKEIREIRSECHLGQRNQKEKAGTEVKVGSTQRKSIKPMSN